MDTSEYRFHWCGNVHFDGGLPLPLPVLQWKSTHTHLTWSCEGQIVPLLLQLHRRRRQRKRKNRERESRQVLGELESSSCFTSCFSWRRVVVAGCALRALHLGHLPHWLLVVLFLFFSFLILLIPFPSPSAMTKATTEKTEPPVLF